ncbi:hypothetical protein WA588_005949 [Blastocystis sp. NMH]
METLAEPQQHKFWNTQPVPQDNGEGQEGPIDAIKTPDEIRAEPYRLPPGFQWVDIDVNDEKDIEDVYKLLLENYVEDDGAQFRFAYSPEMLRWALTPPGYKKEYHIGIRVTKTGALLGFITAVPQMVHVRDKLVNMVDVNFLCVHKKIRSKRLAPVLIKEITRRVNRNDGWQAVYTAGISVPTPITNATYFHRSLNPRKLIDIDFARVPSRLTITGYLRFLRLPQEFTIPGFRMLEEKDIPEVLKLLKEYMKQFAVYPEFTEEEARHFFLPRKGVVGSYVVENQGHVTDFISFFHIQSTVINNPKYDTFTATYCYYYAAMKTDLNVLFENALIAAKAEGGDVFNALEILNNAKVFEDLKFARGDGTLHYYFYNWKLNQIEPSQMGIVLP